MELRSGEEMKTTVYLIRHAQSHPSSRLPRSEWPLSAAGRLQAERLADLLPHLKIGKLYSSPFSRCLQTVKPFAKKTGLDIAVHDDLRERLIALTLVDNFQDIWRKSWEDYDFALPGCETSNSAQRRMSVAITGITDANEGQVIAVSTHGNVMGLFLNSIEPDAGIAETEQLTNPDVVKIVGLKDGLHWDRTFHLSGLEGIATDHRDSPMDK